MRNENSKILPFMYSKKENSIPREWNVTTLVFSMHVLSNAIEILELRLNYDVGVTDLRRTVFGSIVLRTKSKDNILQIRQIREIGE
ncbi:uncharacterized protein OCT59_020032 [Rhizophagus irregularis]|uniref:uncharacterized protein n=1 Tax=Rhizophagus irregularis TaxID=588596 RepID=UPI0033265A6F|nr:hypothetical protein OCT59_020032 [Rhizophagus irregularis]